MKKKVLVIIYLVIIQFGLKAQVKETITQNRADQIGLKSKKDFIEQSWFNPTYTAYSLNRKAIKKLKKYADTFQIKVFMAVWCHDSQREIPHLYKILETIDFNLKNLEIIAVDRSKKTPDNLQEGLDITKTPTIIFYRNNQEIGRYVEIPRKSLEKDMLRIVSGKPYKHTYQID